jgi:excisionase family DNA binding protein
MAEWITTAEAAKISGYTVDYIRRLIRSGAVKGRKPWGRDWQVSKAGLLAHQRKAEKQGSKRGPKSSD